MGHAELLIKQHPQVPPLRAAVHPFSSQPLLGLGTAPNDHLPRTVGEFSLVFEQLCVTGDCWSPCAQTCVSVLISEDKLVSFDF